MPHCGNSAPSSLALALSALPKEVMVGPYNEPSGYNPALEIKSEPFVIHNLSSPLIVLSYLVVTTIISLGGRLVM